MARCFLSTMTMAAVVVVMILGVAVPARGTNAVPSAVPSAAVPSAAVPSAAVPSAVPSAAPSAPAAPPAPRNVTIETISFLGSGCSPENTQYVLSPDYSTVTFIFGAMIATTEGGLTDERRNCLVSLGLNYPVGWSVSLGRVTGRGYARLDAGVKGVYTTSYYFSGRLGTARVRRTLLGPLESDYECTDDFVLLVWSQCGSNRYLNINSEVRVNSRMGGHGVMTLDSLDKKFKLIYSMLWKQC